MLEPYLILEMLIGCYMSITREDAKLCVGDGWAKLIDEIFDCLLETAMIIQVKEKFGGLRFYVDGISEEVMEKVDAICEKSLSTCEWCGGMGSQRTVRSWITTLCDYCYAKAV